MSIRMLSCFGVALFFVALVSGCSLFGSRSASGDATSNECRSNPRSCLYDGHYESGERGYAEEEAARLNAAEVARLRRSSGQ
jgi:hypothetical protein